MKFRGVITELSAMREFMSKLIIHFCSLINKKYYFPFFLDIANSLSKICKVCVMRITLTKLYFIVSDEEGGPKQPLVWCELPVNYYFREYTVCGVSDEYNEIYLEFATRKLMKQDAQHHGS